MEWRLAAAWLALPKKEHKWVINQVPQQGITRDPIPLRTRAAQEICS